MPDSYFLVNAADSTQPQQLLTLTQLGIASLSLSATASSETNNGNLIGLISSYTLTNGQTHEMADVFLQVNSTQAGASGLTASQVASLSANEAQSLSLQVSSLSQALSANNSPQTTANTLTNSLTNSLSTGGVGSVAASVGGLANILSQFDANGHPLTASVTANSVVSSTPLAPKSLVIPGILAS